jgi:hypothetical protein
MAGCLGCTQAMLISNNIVFQSVRSEAQCALLGLRWVSTKCEPAWQRGALVDALDQMGTVLSPIHVRAQLAPCGTLDC